MRKIASTFLFLILAICLFSQPCESETLILRTVRATQTDPNISIEGRMHQVFYNPECIQNDKLVLHFVGSYDNPNSTTFFPTLAANHGYKVIVLRYRNEVAASSACEDSSDEFCYNKFREEIMFGNDLSEDVSVDFAGSIFNRFLQLLLYLKDEHPEENWDSFLSELNQINWDKIILSGHSQGGGHAAYLAKLFKVERVLMFAAPNDYSNTFDAPAPWVSLESLTPETDYYSFGNLLDEVVEYEKQFSVWETLNLFSSNEASAVDEVKACDYNDAQVLFTNYESNMILGGNHNSLIIDNFTPIESGKPVFHPVWEYMLGICDTQTSSNELDQEIPEISLFPNPSNGYFYIDSSSEIKQVQAFDLTGKILGQWQVDARRFNIELQKTKGVFFIRLVMQDNTIKLKKVIMK